MDLTNEFTLPLPPEQAWALITDLKRMAAFLPGARLDEVDGPAHRGEMKIEVGPLRATYRGSASLVDLDLASGRAVLRAEGLADRQGRATATVTATLAPAGSGTRVIVGTDLNVGGQVAEFGRSVLVDVSVKVMEEFVDRLRADLEARNVTKKAPTASPGAVGARQVAGAAANAGVPLARLAAPIGLAVGVAVLILLRRRRR